MSIISILSPNRKQLIAIKPLLNILYQIKSGMYCKEIEKIRQAFESGGTLPAAIKKDILPWFSISGHFRQYRNTMELVNYSGNMIFEIIYLDETDQRDAKKALVANPHVFAVFKNTEGSGVNFIVNTNSQFPNHQINFWKAKSYFQEYLGLNRISIKGESPDCFCRFSWDPDLYMNLKAEVFSLSD